MRIIQILLVEDNEADAFLMGEVFKESRYESIVHVVTDGVQAMAFLRREGSYAEAVRPDVILLDLNMPKKDGRSVLSEVKSNPLLRSIPVIVLTTSESAEDIRLCYDLHANCYVTKPLGLDEMFEVVQSIEDFWFKVARLPELPP